MSAFEIITLIFIFGTFAIDLIDLVVKLVKKDNKK